MEKKVKKQFIHFLKQDLNIPAESISLALRDSTLRFGSLPMILWQYGLISRQQLEQIFDWLDNVSYQGLMSREQ